MNGNFRVGLDANAPYVSRAGVARYVEGLLDAFGEIKPADCAVTPIAWRVPNLRYEQPQRMLKTAYRELWWGKVVAPRLLRRERIDLFHSTGGGQYVRIPAGIRHVATLHDVSVARHPERFRRWQLATWRHRMRRLARADRVICSSTFTANEAMELLGLPARHIDVVPLGCDWHPATLKIAEQVPDFAVPGEFFLFVGTLEPGKNLALLRHTWSAAAEAGRPLPPLLIVGDRRMGVPTEGTPPVGWHYLGRQPDGVLLHLYRRAQALVFPSVYEGFGLPVIEAMAVGCPVVCSPVASLPEVAGDAALLAPLEPAAYLGRLRELLTDRTLRSDLINRGHKNAARFTWARCAAATLAVYRSALRLPGS
ncbi:MAG TPA: glycosyltransferase family 1 protein [Opitutus sp.]|nr:glycosyltransferase family 1 protein [Opitutus sp.]